MTYGSLTAGPRDRAKGRRLLGAWSGCNQALDIHPRRSRGRMPVRGPSRHAPAARALTPQPRPVVLHRDHARSRTASAHRRPRAHGGHAVGRPGADAAGGTRCRRSHQELRAAPARELPARGVRDEDHRDAGRGEGSTRGEGEDRGLSADNSQLPIPNSQSDSRREPRHLGCWELEVGR